MALIVGGTTVTGTQTLDATKLTGNLPALNGGSLTSLTPANIASGTLPSLNGSNLTSLPAASTIAALSSNAVTSFGFLRVGATVNNNSTMVPGNYGNNNDQYRGHWSNSSGATSSPASGTWRAFGNATNGTGTLFQRIS
tara:strand:+ start:684 stop:1100 length:417 start_codon:yes stop_codon:yes gene_type:complete